MNKEEVTEQWVKDNFNLDLERKLKEKTVINHYDLEDLLVADSAEECKNRFVSIIDEMTDENAFNTTVEVNIEDNGFLGMDQEIVVKNSVEYNETDNEVVKRIKKRERKKLEVREDQLKKEREQEERDRLEWERLRKKFGE